MKERTLQIQIVLEKFKLLVRLNKEQKRRKLWYPGAIVVKSLFVSCKKFFLRLAEEARFLEDFSRRLFNGQERSLNE